MLPFSLVVSLRDIHLPLSLSARVFMMQSNGEGLGALHVTSGLFAPVNSARFSSKIVYVKKMARPTI